MRPVGRRPPSCGTLRRPGATADSTGASKFRGGGRSDRLPAHRRRQRKQTEAGPHLVGSGAERSKAAKAGRRKGGREAPTVVLSGRRFRASMTVMAQENKKKKQSLQDSV